MCLALLAPSDSPSPLKLAPTSAVAPWHTTPLLGLDRGSRMRPSSTGPTRLAHPGSPSPTSPLRCLPCGTHITTTWRQTVPGPRSSSPSHRGSGRCLTRRPWVHRGTGTASTAWLGPGQGQAHFCVWGCQGMLRLWAGVPWARCPGIREVTTSGKAMSKSIRNFPWAHGLRAKGPCPPRYLALQRTRHTTATARSCACPSARPLQGIPFHGMCLHRSKRISREPYKLPGGLRRFPQMSRTGGVEE